MINPWYRVCRFYHGFEDTSSRRRSYVRAILIMDGVEFFTQQVRYDGKWECSSW